jgi:hypothetical protein
LTEAERMLELLDVAGLEMVAAKQAGNAEREQHWRAEWQKAMDWAAGIILA